MAFLRHCFHFIFTFLFLFPSLQLTLSDSGSIGINYGRVADDLPSPAEVVQLLKAQGVTKTKIFDTDATVLSAFSGSGITITVALPNEHLSDAAGSQSFTDTWVQSNIIPYHPNTLIDAIAVGNEVFSDPQNTPFLVPAMKNIYASLVKYDVASSIKVSSPVTLGSLGTSYPSSSGSFKSDLVEPVIKPLLSFLKQTGSYLMVNAYPFFAYTANADVISLDYALFQNNAAVTDPNNGLVYKSLLEAQLDAVFAAMSAVGFKDMKIVVTETGWPSKGDENEIGAGKQNAAVYNGNLVRRVLTGSGTPLRPDEPLNVFIFALFNENQKPGPTSEKNYGLFYPNEAKVYDIQLTLKGLSDRPIMMNVSKIQVVSQQSSGGGDGGQTWCVANGMAGVEKLQKALDYVCDEGGVDCRKIHPGAMCYDPNTLEARASYAFNSYYQKNARGSGTCNFGGAAYVVTQPPKFGNCEFSTGH
ncbi:O-Glycosyl hydrolase family 17 protein [Abeliophyllum distichum]|uniref:glucan endo-1,3-beta-D-glucosidase n=1 Tax=Abeliophyllum distichum TaxID=126358 RepID=A0ABD1QMA5_9LAMI